LFNNISLLLTHQTRIPSNGVPVSGRPSLTPENYAGTSKFVMPGVHCTPKNE